MIVLLGLLVFLMLTYVVIGKTSKKMYCIIALISLMLVAALRSYQVGPDGPVYANYFKKLQGMEFAYIAEYFNKDPIFYYVTKLLQNIGVGLQGWYAVIGGLFAFSVMLVIYKYSESLVYSIVALLSLGYYAFSFTGLRQVVALAIILISTVFLEKKKYIIFIALVMVATLFHSSALIFLIILPFKFMYFSRKQYVIGTCLGFVSVILFKGEIYNIISFVIDETERLEGYRGYFYGASWMGYIIQLAIFLFALCCIDNKGFIDNKLFFDLSFWGVFFQLFSSLMAEMFRISMYFSIFNIILIANTCKHNRFTEYSQKLVKIIIMVMLLYYFIHSHINYQYMFYWT